VFVGGRYSNVFGGKWIVSARGDIGFGGSDFAWFVNTALGYRLGKSMSVGVAYRILSLDYETGSGASYYKYDVATHGLGLVFGVGF
jgi:hypothetical protein